MCFHFWHFSRFWCRCWLFRRLLLSIFFFADVALPPLTPSDVLWYFFFIFAALMREVRFFSFSTMLFIFCMPMIFRLIDWCWWHFSVFLRRRRICFRLISFSLAFLLSTIDDFALIDWFLSLMQYFRFSRCRFRYFHSLMPSIRWGRP